MVQYSSVGRRGITDVCTRKLVLPIRPPARLDSYLAAVQVAPDIGLSSAGKTRAHRRFFDRLRRARNRCYSSFGARLLLLLTRLIHPCGSCSQH